MPRLSALARRRRSRGHTQESLAQRLGVDVSSVARWERGISTPSPGVRRALAGELAVTLDGLAALLGPPSATVPPAARQGVHQEHPVLIKDIWGAAERDDLAVRLGAGAPPEPGTAPEPGGGEGGHGHAVEVVHQWLITPPPPAHAHRSHGRPRRIGATELDGVRARLRYLHRTDDTVAGGDLYPAVRDELARTAALLRTTSSSAATGRDLLRLLAELCQLAGWSAADAGDEGAGTRHHVHGIKAAHAADAPVLAAQLVSSLGYHLAEHGHGRDAVTVTRSALTRLDAVGHGSAEAAQATPAVRALLHARTAWAHAVTGERALADEALRRAEDAYGARRAGTDPDPAWAYWLTPDEMQIIAGRLDVALGRPRRGGERIGAALAACDPRRVRETVLYTAWLAHSHLRRHDHGAATELARQARHLNGTIRSRYADRALTRLTHRLSTPPRSAPN
ncbi:multiprotein-bridging factor 1 family protein [Streptomyces sp. NPDC004134]|uniref:helix-turn-helix domain-containing protein n=1 Tax=Streptomyces sp. NPDC004134 TaxID=3364691 RepID=UPI0036CBF28E